jgi:hypothetical protein
MSASRLVSLMFAAMLIVGPALVARAADPVYYPLAVGNVWEYTIKAGANMATMTATLSKTEKIDDVELLVLEGKVNGNVVATEHLKATAEGVFRHRNQGVSVDPPFKLFAYPAKEDAAWKGELKTGGMKSEFSATSGAEEVEVPAGKFKTIRVKFDLPSEKSEITYWFAENVGFVKQVIKTPVLEATLTLDKFTPAPAK